MHTTDADVASVAFCHVPIIPAHFLRDKKVAENTAGKLEVSVPIVDLEAYYCETMTWYILWHKDPCYIYDLFTKTGRLSVHV